MTLKDVYPLLRIEDNLDKLSRSTWFSTLYRSVDFGRSKWTRRVSPELPFPLVMVDYTNFLVLAELQWQIAVLYIDNIVVFGSTVEEHLDRLEILFGRLCKAGLKLKLSKCTLMKRKVDFLGHVVSARGAEADQKKIMKIIDWPQPTSKTEVRSFIGCYAHIIADSFVASATSVNPFFA